MIEFEKWAKTKKPYDPFCCHGMMEAAWKAALGWALSSGSWENIVNNIKKELKNRKA